MTMLELPMIAFRLTNGLSECHSDYISLSIEDLLGFPATTSWAGGYDGKGTLKIVSENYRYQGPLYFTTGELYGFYIELQKCYQTLKGSAILRNYESAFYMELTMDKLGKVACRGWSKEMPSRSNRLEFEIDTDQTFIKQTIDDLEAVVKCFGDMRGIKGKRL